jgi:predicted amidophosphoribosyltransferase
MERCPVCRARFRDEAICSRCGADLSPLLAIEAEAVALEREAVALLAAGHWIEARRAAERALALQYSPLAAAARDFAGRELVAEETRRFERLLQ